MVYYVYGVFGVKLLGDLSWQQMPEGVNYWANWETFPRAVLTMFRVSTLDDWPRLMMSATGGNSVCLKIPGKNCGQKWYMIYFLSFIFIQAWVVLNLFLAVLIDNFTDYAGLDSQVRHLHQFQIFQDKWKEVDPKGTGYINVDDLLQLLLGLGHPLGFDEISQTGVVHEFEMMNIHLTADNQIEFDELLRALTQRSCKLDLKDHLHLHTDAQGQLGNADGRACVLAILAEDLNQEIGRAVGNLGLVSEAGSGGDKDAELDDANNAIERAEGRLDVRECIDDAHASCFLSLLEGNAGSELAIVHKRIALLGNLTGNPQLVAGDDGGNVAERRGSGGRQNDTLLLQSRFNRHLA